MIRVIKPILKTYPEFQELNNALKITGMQLYPYMRKVPHYSCSPYYMIMLCLIGATYVNQCRMGVHSRSTIPVSPKMMSLVQRCTNKLRKDPLVCAELLQHHLGLKESISV